MFRAALGFVAVACAIAGWYAANDVLERSQPGYCLTQNRYIPDEEFIQAAVALYEWEASRRNIYYDPAKVGSNQYLPLDNGGFHSWERMRKRPDCCAVYRGGTVPLVSRILGQQKIEVALYLKPEKPGDGFLSFSFDVCGKLLPSAWGYNLPANILLYDHELTTSNYEALIGTK